MDKESRAGNPIHIVVSINCYLFSFNYGTSYAAHCFVNTWQLVRRVHVFESGVKEILGLHLGGYMTSGKDQGHQRGDCQGLLYLMGEGVVGRPRLPEEPGSPNSIGRNFSVHSFRRSSPSPIHLGVV